MTVKDWNKPIETVDGEEAYYLRTDDEGDHLITYWSDRFGDYATEWISASSENFRNKAELIMPDNVWIAVYDDGSWCSDGPGYPLDVTVRHYPNADVYISLHELMSGDFKDDIKKGHGKDG